MAQTVAMRGHRSSCACRLQHAFTVDEQNSEGFRIAYLTKAHSNLFGLDNGLEIKLLLRVSGSIKSENNLNLNFFFNTHSFIIRLKGYFGLELLAVNPHVCIPHLASKNAQGSVLEDFIAPMLSKKEHLVKALGLSEGFKRVKLPSPCGNREHF